MPMEDRTTKMDNTTHKIWPAIFEICFQLRDNKNAVPDDVCRICFMKTMGGQNRTEHHVKCYRWTRCDMCKMNIYELYPKAPTIHNFTAHTILCVGHGLHKCLNCSERYTNYEEAKNHYKHCRKNVVCFACNQPFEAQSNCKSTMLKNMYHFDAKSAMKYSWLRGNLDLHSVMHK